MRRALALALLPLAAPACTSRGAGLEGGGAPARVSAEDETVARPSRRFRVPEVAAPRTTWPKEPRLRKEATQGWRLQGLQHWEASGDEHRDLFLEQETSITYVLRAPDPKEGSRLVRHGSLHVLEVFPCLHRGGSSVRETNDIHDFRLDLDGACAGELRVESRLRLGWLHYVGAPLGLPGARVTEGERADDFRFHLLEANFAMRHHRVEPGFVFEPASKPTRTAYAFAWDECADSTRRGSPADRVPVGGVRQWLEEP